MSIAVRMVPQSSEVKYYGRGREVSYPATAAPPLKAIEGRGLEGEEGGGHLSSLSTFCYRHFARVCIMKIEEGSTKKQKKMISCECDAGVRLLYRTLCPISSVGQRKEKPYECTLRQ